MLDAGYVFKACQFFQLAVSEPDTKDGLRPPFRLEVDVPPVPRPGGPTGILDRDQRPPFLLTEIEKGYLVVVVGKHRAPIRREDRYPEFGRLRDGRHLVGRKVQDIKTGFGRLFTEKY